MQELKLYDYKCPVCGEIGGGIIFHSEHSCKCGVDTTNKQFRVEDIEYEQVNLIESNDEKM